MKEPFSVAIDRGRGWIELITRLIAAFDFGSTTFFRISVKRSCHVRCSLQTNWSSSHRVSDMISIMSWYRHATNLLVFLKSPVVSIGIHVSGQLFSLEIHIKLVHLSCVIHDGLWRRRLSSINAVLDLIVIEGRLECAAHNDFLT